MSRSNQHIRSSLTRLLNALQRAWLLRLCELYATGLPSGYVRKADLIDRLARTPQVDAVELARHVLRKPELIAVCRALGLMPEGTRDQLGQRVARALKWRPFADARAFAQSLGLRNHAEWLSYARGELEQTHGLRPPDIPVGVGKVYRDAGWQGIGDFLGTGRVANQLRDFLPYDEARRLSRAHGFLTQKAWRQWRRGQLDDLPPCPNDIPTYPEGSYGEDWLGWEDFLGPSYKPRIRPLRPYQAARELVQRLGLDTGHAYFTWYRGDRPDLPPCPHDLPFNPNTAYPEWTGWGDFLGTGRVANTHRTWRPFREARAFARSLDLSGEIEWFAWLRGDLSDKPPRPEDIPTMPRVSYCGEWQGMADWLGTSNVFNRDVVFLPFAEARERARSLGLRSSTEYRAWHVAELARRPKTNHLELPGRPRKYYRAEWTSWEDFLGEAPLRSHRQWRPFPAARTFVRTLQLKDSHAWRAYSRGDLAEQVGTRPPDIPSAPYRTYRADWQGWDDFLHSPAPDR